MRQNRKFFLLSSIVIGFSLCGCGSEGAASDANAEVGSQESAAQASIVLDVPYVAQNPELNRGCEVTALTMLLRYAGVGSADKMELAEQMEKVPYKEDGFYGNPYDAFVGDMYTFQNPGYGVYHGPVARLAEQYMPNQILDLTGTTFDTLLTAHVAKGRPVWIISNARWQKLADSEFETWHTRTGDVRITWHEHSVVITGYDATSVYINDPLDPSKGKNKKLDRTKFREAWEQMGRQAITYHLGI